MAISPAGMASLIKALPPAARPNGAGASIPPPAAAAGPPLGMPANEGMGGSAIFDSVIKRTLADTGTADPAYILDLLKQMKSISANVIPMTALRFSGVAKHMANVYRSLDAALGEAEKAQSQMAAQGPINFSGANAAAAQTPGPTPVSAVGAPMPSQVAM